MKTNRILQTLAVIALLGMATFHANAADRTWDGSTGTWDTPTNWSGDGLPTSSDSTEINNGGTVQLPVSVSGSYNNLHLGNTSAGSGTINITGGLLSGWTSLLAETAGGMGAATVTSGTWSNFAYLSVGGSGTGSLLVNGGLVTGADGYIGSYGDGEGEGSVTVTSGTWSNSGYLYVGYNGTGNILVNGGLLTSSEGYIGGDGVSVTGTATVMVTSGTWSNSNSLDVGNLGTIQVNGTGSLLTSSGTSQLAGTGIVSNGGMFSSSSQLKVTGGTFTVASSGTATLDKLSVDGGSVSVTGSGSQLSDLSTAFVVGGTNASSLTVSAGGKVDADGDLDIAVGDGVQGSVTVTGAGSELQVEHIYVGQSVPYVTGIGSLQVTDGGKVSAAQLNVRHGSVEVDGTGSELSLDGLLYVSTTHTGTTSLSITNGGILTSEESALIGGYTTQAGHNEVTISGAGSQLTAHGQVVLGWDSPSSETNVMTIADGGVVDVTLYGWDRKIVLASGTSTLQIGDGAAPGILNAQDVIGSGVGTATIVFNHNQAGYIFSPNLSGELNVVYQGTGSTILSGTNTFSGQTTVSNGTLIIDGDQSGSSASVAIAAGATLAGSGIIGGDVDVYGTLSPGNSPGLLSIDGDLTMEAISNLVMEFNGTGAGQYDQLSVGGTFTAGGTLQLTMNYAAQQGDTFTLFTNGGYDAGSFNISSNLGGGLYWDASNLASNGTIGVVPEPGSLALFLLGGGALLMGRRRRRSLACETIFALARTRSVTLAFRLLPSMKNIAPLIVGILLGLGVNCRLQADSLNEWLPEGGAVTGFWDDGANWITDRIFHPATDDEPAWEEIVRGPAPTTGAAYFNVWSSVVLPTGSRAVESYLGSASVDMVLLDGVTTLPGIYQNAGASAFLTLEGTGGLDLEGLWVDSLRIEPGVTVMVNGSPGIQIGDADDPYNSSSVGGILVVASSAGAKHLGGLIVGGSEGLLQLQGGSYSATWLQLKGGARVELDVTTVLELDRGFSAYADEMGVVGTVNLGGGRITSQQSISIDGDLNGPGTLESVTGGISFSNNATYTPSSPTDELLLSVDPTSWGVNISGNTVFDAPSVLTVIGHLGVQQSATLLIALGETLNVQGSMGVSSNLRSDGIVNVTPDDRRTDYSNGQLDLNGSVWASGGLMAKDVVLGGSLVLTGDLVVGGRGSEADVLLFPWGNIEVGSNTLEMWDYDGAAIEGRLTIAGGSFRSNYVDALGGTAVIRLNWEGSVEGYGTIGPVTGNGSLVVTSGTMNVASETLAVGSIDLAAGAELKMMTDEVAEIFVKNVTLSSGSRIEGGALSGNLNLGAGGSLQGAGDIDLRVKGHDVTITATGELGLSSVNLSEAAITLGASDLFSDGEIELRDSQVTLAGGYLGTSFGVADIKLTQSTVTGFGEIGVPSLYTVESNGSVFVASDGELKIDGPLKGNGVLVGNVTVTGPISGMDTGYAIPNLLVLTGDAVVFGQGRTHLDEGIDFGRGTRLSAPDGVTLGPDAVVQGGGTIAGDVTNEGKISPGNSPGIVTIEGNLFLSSSSRIEMELGGTVPGGDYDQIVVTDDILFGGELSLTNIGPVEVGDSFILFAFGGDAIGSFANIHISDQGLVGNFDYASGVLTLGAVPEPSTWAMMIVGGAALLVRRRRRTIERVRPCPLTSS